MNSCFSHLSSYVFQEYYYVRLTKIGVLSGEIWATWDLFSHSRKALLDQITVSFLSCLGNIFIYMLLSRRGPIVLALVTTTRKVFTVLISIKTSNSKLGRMKQLGIGIVILGLLCECVSSVTESQHKERKEKEKIKEAEEKLKTTSKKEK